MRVSCPCPACCLMHGYKRLYEKVMSAHERKRVQRCCAHKWMVGHLLVMRYRENCNEKGMDTTSQQASKMNTDNSDNVEMRLMAIHYCKVS